MVSRAVSVAKVDAALGARYSGITIDIGGIPTAVEVFLENPMPEEKEDRVYPSISIVLIGLFEEPSVLDSDDDLREEVGYDTGIIPYERYMRERPIPSRLVYSIGAWHKTRVKESRELLFQAITKRTRPKGVLTVENIDGIDVSLWSFWAGGVSRDREVENDQTIYRNTLTLEVLADISPVEFDDYASTKVAMEINWDVYSRKMVMNGDNDITIVDGEDVKDLRLRFTDTEEEGIP